MKKVILQKDLIDYLNKEIIRIRKTSPNVMTDIRDPSFMNGYKEGQLAALMRVLNHIWMN